MPLSFELNEDMISGLNKEYSFAKLIDRLKDIKENKIEVLLNYGKELAGRVVQYSDEYPDRTYEILLDAVKQTGTGYFPLLPQRCLEIAYLSVNDMYELPIVESSKKKLIYKVENCRISLCSDLSLYCENACIGLAKAIIEHFKVQANISNTKALSDGYCEFIIENLQG